MPESNPYEPPRAAPGESHERLLAAKLLEIRARDGYPFKLFQRKYTWLYVRRLGLLAGLFALLIGTRLWALLLFSTGLFLGSYAAFFRWMRSAQRSWPLLSRVIDWEEVEKIAGEPPAGAESGTENVP